MLPNRKRRSSGSKPKGSKRTKSTWDVGIEKFITQLQSQEIVKREPNKRLSSARPNTKGDLPPQYTVAFPMSGYHMHPLFSQPTGSHTFGQAEIVGCGMVTVGNTSSDSGNDSNPTYASIITPNLSGHTFDDLRISDSRGVHIGNTGTGGEGHKFTKLQVERSVAPHIGNFSTMEVKYVNFQMYHQVAELSTRG
ncbi:hypothetical protein F4679DRAFT_542740 [Xylaria curta]|nr:hypothetical protein F4679DRAFT_542740 [Xylaria curta]